MEVKVSVSGGRKGVLFDLSKQNSQSQKLRKVK